jgi:hypothetical protein
MKIWLSEEGMDIMAKNCRVRTWIVGCAFKNLFGMEILSKNALILGKKSPSSIPSCAPKIPLHVAQIPLQKWGI